jgi:hypothetical protein
VKGIALAILLLTSLASAQEPPLIDVERSLAVGTNDLRARSNCHPLVLDPMLSDIARGHSEEMLSKKYFGHDSPNQMCKTVSDRLRYGHRFCLTSAENLHKSQGYSRSRLAKLAIDSWMESASHHRNMVNPRFNRVGIGIACKGDVYLFTQLFSYEPLIIQTLNCLPEGEGFRVKVTALVADGPKEGGWFVDGKRQSSWEAGPDGMISADLLLPRACSLEIGQLVGVRSWEVETTIPIPPPEMHTKHTWSSFPAVALNWLKSCVF